MEEKKPEVTENSNIDTTIELPKKVNEPEKVSEQPEVDLKTLPNDNPNAEDIFGKVPESPEESTQNTTPAAETPQESPEAQPEVSNSQPAPEVQSKIEFNQSINIETPGQDQVIGQIKPEKTGSPIFIIILFIILGVFAFGLPTFSDYITNYRNSKLPVAPSGNQSEQPTEIPDVTLEKFPLNENTIVKVNDDITVSQFSFTNENETSYVKYRIVKSVENVSIPTNLYIEFYDEKNELIGRSKINIYSQDNSTTILDYQSIAPSAASQATQVAVIAKSEDTLPYRELEVRSDGTQLMTCVGNRHTIAYTFRDYFLIGFEEKFNGIRSSNPEGYAAELQQRQELSAKLRQFDGVTTSIVTSDTGYTMTNTFDLTYMINVRSLNNFAYFESATMARKIAFDMEASGYTCS